MQTTTSSRRSAVLALYLATLQLFSLLATLNASGVEKYVTTRRGRYDTDSFRFIYKTGYNCPADVCTRTAAWVNNTVPCGCSCKSDTPTFIPELGRCGNTADVKKSLFGSCSEALGMESGKIHDSQLSSFSQFSNVWRPSEGRLNNNGAWCSYSNAVNEFFGIDLLEVRHVSIIATQGYEGQYRHNFVRTFMIEYSYDGVSWLFYKDRNGQNKIFAGNSDSNTIKYNHFKGTFETRFLKIYPKIYNAFMCLRVELYGCSDNAVCSRFFEWPFFLKSLNLGNEGSENIGSDKNYDSCQVVPRSAAYYNYQLHNKWMGICGDIFKVEIVQEKLVFKWTVAIDKNLLAGRIVRVMVTCNYSTSASRPSKTACLIFKTSGQITYDTGGSVNGTIEFSCPVKPSTVAKTTSILLHPSSSSMIPFYTEPAKPSMSSSVTESASTPGPNGGIGDKDARTSGNGNGIVIGAAVGCVALFGIFIMIIIIFCKRRKMKNNGQAAKPAVNNPVYGNSEYEAPVRGTTGKQVATSSDQNSQPTYQITDHSEKMNGAALYSSPEENRYDNRPVYQSLDKNIPQTPGYQKLMKGQHATAQPTPGVTGQPSALPEPVYNVLEKQKPDMAQENVQDPLYNVLEGPYAVKSCEASRVQDPLYNVLEQPDSNHGQQEPLYNILDRGPEAANRPFEDASSNECLYNVLDGPDSGGPDNSGADYAAPREPLSLDGHDNPSYEQSLEFNVPYALVHRSGSQRESVYEPLRGAGGDDVYEPLK